MKLLRNIKSTMMNVHKKKLGTSIAECPNDINNRTEFAHWEIDTIIVKKTNNDFVLLTIV